MGSLDAGPKPFTPESGSKFALLLQLAGELSSEHRRELLRNITDIFVADPAAQGEASYAAFDEIAGTVVADFTAEVRAEVARSLTASALPLGRTARQLALDDIEIARPVIEGWAALSDNDLVEVVTTKSQDHMFAVTKRPELAERVSSALVAHGEDRVVASLLTNTGARIDRHTYEKVAERAETSTVLQAPFVRRKGVPVDLLNDLYASVEPALRQDILRQYENVSPQELEIALERSRKRVSKLYSERPADFDASEKQLKKLDRAGEVKPPILVRLMREGAPSRTLFLLAFAKLTDADYATVTRLIEARDMDGLALLCRAAGFDRALFLALTLAVVSEDNAMSRLDEFSALYEKVPVLAAQRAVRFWKLRTNVA